MKAFAVTTANRAFWSQLYTSDFLHHVPSCSFSLNLKCLTSPKLLNWNIIHKSKTSPAWIAFNIFTKNSCTSINFEHSHYYPKAVHETQIQNLERKADFKLLFVGLSETGLAIYVTVADPELTEAQAGFILPASASAFQILKLKVYITIPDLNYYFFKGLIGASGMAQKVKLPATRYNTLSLMPSAQMVEREWTPKSVLWSSHYISTINKCKTNVKI